MSCLPACCCTFPPPHKAAGALLHQLCSLQFTTEHPLFLPLFCILPHSQPVWYSSSPVLHSSTLTASVVLFPQFCILPHTQPVSYCFPSSAFFHTHSCTVLYCFPSSAFFHTHSQCRIVSPVLHSSTLTASVVLFPQFCILPHTQLHCVVLFPQFCILPHTQLHCVVLFPQFCILPHSQPVWYCSSPVLHSSSFPKFCAH